MERDSLKACLEQLDVSVHLDWYDDEDAVVLVFLRSNTKGDGSRAMLCLLAYADSAGYRVFLTPDPVGPKAGSRKYKARLTRWYKSQGFVPNKGSNKDYAFRETLVRTPQQVVRRNGYVPEKYLAGLTPELRRQRRKELKAASRGEFGYRELPTDAAARRMGLVKKGQYTKAAESRGIAFNGDFDDTARRAFRYYGVSPSAKSVAVVSTELQKIFNKGLAAWRTGGHRPGASQRAWGYARINSVLTGGKAYYTADKKNRERFPRALQKAIEAQRVWSPA